jgi:hypothetical protein
MGWKYARLTKILVIVAWALYSILSIFAPAATSARFHLAEPALFLLQLTIIIPLFLIWTTAARSASTFKHYAALVKSGREGRAMGDIANGLLWTLVYLVDLSLGGVLVQHFSSWRYFDFLVVIRDHVPALLSLIGFFLLLRGSHRLRHTADFTTWTSGTFFMLTGFAAFCILFVLEFSLASPNGVSRTSLDIVPRPILLITQILPYLVSWFMGLLAGLNIAKYSLNVHGILYRKAFRNVVIGIWGVVLFSVIIQVITLSTRYLLNWNLAGIVLLLYGLMLLYSLCFLFINAGAKSLTKLEVPE